MGKKGPCLHCGVTSTPLWRNGPTEKPVLCNACGSRFKSRGSLDNYLPKTVQLRSLTNFYGSANGSSGNLVDDDDKLSDNDSQSVGGEDLDLLASKIPSKKRSKVEYNEATPPTPMHQFFDQLQTLYRNSEPEEFAPEEGTLIYNANNFIPANEIGLGAVLLKPPSPPPPPPPPADNDGDVPKADEEGSSPCTSKN